MSEKYLNLSEVAESLGFSAGTIRAMKAVTNPEIRAVRIRASANGRPVHVYALEDVLLWLRKSMARLSPAQELALLRAAKPLPTNI